MATRPRAVPTGQIDNERVRVTEWRFAPGAATGRHQHKLDYVVVAMSDGKLLIENGVAVEADLVVGKPYFRKAGVEHDVINKDDQQYTFIEIELKH